MSDQEMNQIMTSRESRGLQIAQAKESQVSQVDENFYTVKSQNGNGDYAIYMVDGEWHCECPDHTYRCDANSHGLIIHGNLFLNFMKIN
jgi:hypothetical protein